MEEEIYKLAKKKVKARKGFYGHLSAWVAVGSFFLAINLITFNESGEWWFFWPLLPWGIGLLIHYFSVFGLPGTETAQPDWEEKALVREAERLRRKMMMEKDRTPLPPLPEEPLELKELEKRKEGSWRDEDLV